MDKNLEKAKDIIAILQEQFIDTKFILVTSDEDLEKAKLESLVEESDLQEPEDFWSQDLEDLL